MKTKFIYFMLLALSLCVNAGDKNIPEGVNGFCGTIEGEIIKKGDKSLTITVSAVKNKWKKNTAEKAENLVGKTIVVNEGWYKPKGKDKFEPNGNHLSFIKNVPLGKIVLEIQTGDGDRFHLLELSKEQREIANPEKEGEKEKKKD
jgi:hypothetical protein